jgi:hypothetical protein
MAPQLIGDNRRRQCQCQARRWRLWTNLTVAVLTRGGQARLAEQFGVSRSTICRDMQAYWQWVHQCPRERERREMYGKGGSGGER